MSRRMKLAIALASAVLMFPAVRTAAAPQQTPPMKGSQMQMKHPMNMEPKCKTMMADHDKMMADVKIADDKLDALVAKMTSAPSSTQLAATVAVVTEIVAQRKSMHSGMMKMNDDMMKHMMEHMQAGPESMAMCPMMKTKHGG